MNLGDSFRNFEVIDFWKIFENFGFRSSPPILVYLNDGFGSSYYILFEMRFLYYMLSWMVHMIVRGLYFKFGAWRMNQICQVQHLMGVGLDLRIIPDWDNDSHERLRVTTRADLLSCDVMLFLALLKWVGGTRGNQKLLG